MFSNDDTEVINISRGFIRRTCLHLGASHQEPELHRPVPYSPFFSHVKINKSVTLSNSFAPFETRLDHTQEIVASDT